MQPCTGSSSESHTPSLRRGWVTFIRLELKTDGLSLKRDLEHSGRCEERKGEEKEEERGGERRGKGS
ncbi:hypothetical protein Pmani_027031 [Petrolisthes manimaculis]|uniref:Uncharacterized protein n=1 Tax=Petrolisthes manimaculis TaxID=1843537 RepID=A0AAE1P505_9EUCA|nr:hypothetical protein Pmani_027031 [Petrolisthes manimaculis]